MTRVALSLVQPGDIVVDSARSATASAAPSSSAAVVAFTSSTDVAADASSVEIIRNRRIRRLSQLEADNDDIEASSTTSGVAAVTIAAARPLAGSGRALKRRRQGDIDTSISAIMQPSNSSNGISATSARRTSHQKGIHASNGGASSNGSNGYHANGNGHSALVGEGAVHDSSYGSPVAGPSKSSFLRPGSMIDREELVRLTLQCLNDIGYS